MRTRLLVLTIISLAASTGWLGYRLHRCHRQLAHAERFVISGAVSWGSVCSVIEAYLAVPQPDLIAGVATVAPYCIEPPRQEEFRQLLDARDYPRAAEWISSRVLKYRIPLVIPPDNIGTVGFPPGYK